ncbi:unnamed protein product [Ectocarpus fasciculatus]
MPRDGIKLRDRHRSAGLNDLHSQQTEHPSSRRNLEFSTSPVKYNDELCQLDKNLNDRAALGTFHGGLEVEKGTCTTCVEGQTSKSKKVTGLAPVYSPWHEVKESSLLAKAWREKAQEVLRRTRGCGAKATRSTNCKRAGYPPQWDDFRDQSREPINWSKVSVPQSLIGRVGADAAMERLKVPPKIMTCSQTSCTAETPRKLAGHSARNLTRSSTKKRVSAYLSIKAEQIRSRRDHESWLSRVASGPPPHAQDPLSLVGDCLDCNLRLTGETERQPGVSPPPGDCEDSNHKNLDYLNMMKQYESEADERAAAERREFLSHAHLEGLVDSAQRLLEDKAHLRARTMLYLFGHDHDDSEESDSNRGAGETVEAFARRCLAESKSITQGPKMG